eukprot:g78251.t1
MLYVAQADQLSASPDPRMEVHLAATSSDRKDFNFDIVCNEDLHNPQFSIWTRANRTYLAWTLVFIDYGWEPWRLKEKGILPLHELALREHMRREGLLTYLDLFYVLSTVSMAVPWLPGSRNAAGPRRWPLILQICVPPERHFLKCQGMARGPTVLGEPGKQGKAIEHHGNRNGQ